MLGAGGSCAAAVPAWHLRRPVRLVLDRDEDMQTTGHRHAFLAAYKVCPAQPLAPQTPSVACSCTGDICVRSRSRQVPRMCARGTKRAWHDVHGMSGRG